MKPFRIWQSDDLSSAYEHAAQIASTIESEMQKHTHGPVPNSVLSSEVLWLLATGVVDMYEKLLDLDLIKSGSSTKQSTILH